MKKLKLNKKMVNALIGFTGFTLISSLSSCKCSGIDIDIEDPSITSELTSEDESVVSILDNSEVTTEVLSEEITSETNTELTSESSSEDDYIFDTGNVDGFYNLYCDNLTEAEIEENIKIINEYRNLDSSELTDKQKEKYYTAFLNLYDMNKIFDILDQYRFNEFVYENASNYAMIDNLFIKFYNTQLRIYYLDSDGNPIFYIDQYAFEDEELIESIDILDDMYVSDIGISMGLAGLNLYDMYSGNIEKTKMYHEDTSDEYKKYLKNKTLIKK